MLDAEIIQAIKQTNLSTNGDLTKERAKAILKAASREQKSEICALAGLKRFSIDRVYATGNISGKIAIAMAQTLNLNPFYLTGEIEEQGEYSDEAIRSFLKSKGYETLAKKVKKPVRRTQVKAAPESDVKESVTSHEPQDGAEPQGTTALKNEQEPETLDVVAASEMTEEEAVAILRSLFLQAKFSSHARKKIEYIKAVIASLGSAIY